MACLLSQETDTELLSRFSCSTAPVEISPLEGPSDKSSGVQTNEFMTTSLPSATSNNKSVLVLNPCTDTAFFSL